jgi:hypothetical protein
MTRRQTFTEPPRWVKQNGTSRAPTLQPLFVCAKVREDGWPRTCGHLFANAVTASVVD